MSDYDPRTDTGIPTEPVGSLPRPSSLQQAYAQYDAGEISKDDLESDLDNDWLFLVLSLINETTGETREVTQQLSYYHGADSDGSWTEGDKRESVRIASVPAGRYFLRVQAEGGEAGRASTAYTMRVRRDVPSYGFYGIAVLALLLPAVLSILPSTSFESRRWAESDHAPTGSSNDEED